MTEFATHKEERQQAHDSEQHHILVDTAAVPQQSSNNEDNNISLEENLKTTTIPLKNTVILSEELPQEDMGHEKEEEQKINGRNVERDTDHDGEGEKIGYSAESDSNDKIGYSGESDNSDLEHDNTTTTTPQKSPLISPTNCASAETVFTMLREKIVVDEDGEKEHHTATETVSLQEKFEVQNDIIVESIDMKKVTEIDGGEVDEKLTSNITVISTPEKKTTIEKAEKTSFNENVTDTLAYVKKVVEEIPAHEVTVQLKSTNEKIIDTDKYHTVVEKVTIKDSIKDDVGIETVKVEKTKIDHNPVTDEITIKKEHNKQSMIETPDRVVTFTEVFSEDETEVINDADDSIDDEENPYENTESKLLDFEIVAKSMKSEFSIGGEEEEIKKEIKEEQEGGPEIKKEIKEEQEGGPETPSHEDDPEIMQNLLEIQRKMDELKNQTESIFEESNYLRQRVAVANPLDEEGELSTPPVFRAQTLLDSRSHSPYSIMSDVVDSMFNPGFNRNVVLFLNIIFLLLFASLIFLIIVTDYNAHVIAFLGLSFCLFIATNWFVASVAKAQIEESKIVVAPAGSTEKQE
ncbi:13485_t:CDS:2 [Ambispora leptoticha]|uniref:13485_t:CDS:1 n=1 Tax=Ambispora leptoticha TaxID=144679 RepID=A0A9N8WML9_9GLOM|nr:13485_t:CDS:2 [Ambispora leptoticha]